MELAINVLGIVLIAGLAYVLSSNRRAINWRTVVLAFVVQFSFAALALYFTAGRSVLASISGAVSSLLAHANAGMSFVFGDLVAEGSAFIFAFRVLPLVVFFSALVALLYHLGVMQLVVRVLGGGLQWLLGTSRAESLSAAANIFVSMTEAPLLIKPYLRNMTRSEFFAVMVGGMATVAGSVLAGLAGMGVSLDYLIAASFMAAPGGFMMAKLFEPERPSYAAKPEPEIEISKANVNGLEAVAEGVETGLRVAINIGGMLLAFIGLLSLLNAGFATVGEWLGYPQLSFQSVLGMLFQPVALLLGVPGNEAMIVGQLIGEKLVFNEFVAFVSFVQVQESLSSGSQAIATFALCGFANFASIAVLLGGLGVLVPERRSEVAQQGFRAMLAAALANCMSAALVGLFV